MTKHSRATLAAILTISTISLPAQTTTAAKPTTKKAATKKAPVESPVEREIRELREQMQSQQAQIDALKRQNAEQASQLSAAQQSAQSASAAAAAASAKADSLSSNVSSNAETVSTLNNTVTDLKTTNVGLAQTISDTKKSLSDAMDSPLSIRYKGVEITPVAFFAAESVWRQRALNADINTPFNSTPYPGAGQAHTTEFNFSGRQSRVGALFVGNPGPFRALGLRRS